MDFIRGCNNVIAGTMKIYSTKLKELNNPTVEQCTMDDFDINYMLLHDVILMDVQAYTIKFVEKKKQEEQKTKRKLEEKIDKIQDTTDEDDIEELETLKQCLNDI